MTGWTTRREPEWSEEEQGWMLALAQLRANACRQCGGDLHETTSEDNDGTPGNGAYLPLAPLRCHRCAALSRSEKDWSKDPYPHSLLHRAELRPKRA